MTTTNTYTLNTEPTVNIPLSEYIKPYVDAITEKYLYALGNDVAKNLGKDISELVRTVVDKVNTPVLDRSGTSPWKPIDIYYAANGDKGGLS